MRRKRSTMNQANLQENRSSHTVKFILRSVLAGFFVAMSFIINLLYENEAVRAISFCIPFIACGYLAVFLYTVEASLVRDRTDVRILTLIINLISAYCLTLYLITENVTSNVINVDSLRTMADERFSKSEWFYLYSGILCGILICSTVKCGLSGGKILGNLFLIIAYLCDFRHCITEAMWLPFLDDGRKGLFAIVLLIIGNLLGCRFMGEILNTYGEKKND